MEQDLPSMCSFSIIILALESHYSLNLSHLKGYVLFFLKFSETVRVEEENLVGLQAPEDPHDSSTDTCLTFPYSSNSPRPFPPSPVHLVTDSPIRVSPLFIATSNSSSNNSPIHGSIAEGMVQDPGVLILGGGELPGAEEAEPPPPPVARLLPFPAIFGLVISHLWSLPGVPLLVKPKTWPLCPELLTSSLAVFLQALCTMITLLS